MTARLTRKLVTFTHAFVLDEINEEMPAGSYSVETEDERLDGDTFYAHRHVATTFVVPAPSDKTRRKQYFAIDPAGLEAALMLDQSRTASNQEAKSKEFAALTSAESSREIDEIRLSAQRVVDVERSNI